jgi:glutamate formiminotransferase/formiminotetrahydrofolate cyclodeaminase
LATDIYRPKGDQPVPIVFSRTPYNFNTYGNGELNSRTMQTAFDCIPLLKQMAENGNPNSLSDVGVGALCIKTAVRGAWLNVLINAQGLSDKVWAENIVTEARALLAKNHAACDEIILGIESKLGG